MKAIPLDIQNKRNILIKQILKSFSLTGFHDESEIDYNSGANAYQTISKLKNDIIKIYPKRNTSRLRKGINRKDLDSIRVLKQLLRYYKMTLIVNREQTKSGCKYFYKIAK